MTVDPPPTPDAARAVRNLSIAPLEVQDDFRLKTTFMWQPPTFSFGAVESYHVEYGDVNKMVFKIWVPTRRVVVSYVFIIIIINNNLSLL